MFQPRVGHLQGQYQVPKDVPQGTETCKSFEEV